MTGRKTSVYLSEASAAGLDADPRQLAEVIADGLTSAAATEKLAAIRALAQKWCADYHDDHQPDGEGLLDVAAHQVLILIDGPCIDPNCPVGVEDGEHEAHAVPAPAPVRSAADLLALSGAGDVQFTPPPVVRQPEPWLGRRTVKLGEPPDVLPSPPLPTGHDLLRAEAEGRRP